LLLLLLLLLLFTAGQRSSNQSPKQRHVGLGLLGTHTHALPTNCDQTRHLVASLHAAAEQSVGCTDVT